MLTTFDADAHVLRALRAGAAGFPLKDTPPDELVDAICLAAQGRPMLSPEVTRRLINRVTEPGPDARRTAARHRLDRLADGQRVVAISVGAGSSDAEIAAAHHISLATVKTHVSAILTKLDLNNRLQVRSSCTTRTWTTPIDWPVRGPCHSGLSVPQRHGLSWTRTTTRLRRTL